MDFRVTTYCRNQTRTSLITSNIFFYKSFSSPPFFLLDCVRVIFINVVFSSGLQKYPILQLLLNFFLFSTRDMCTREITAAFVHRYKFIKLQSSSLLLNLKNLFVFQIPLHRFGFVSRLNLAFSIVPPTCTNKWVSTPVVFFAKSLL